MLTNIISVHYLVIGNEAAAPVTYAATQESHMHTNRVQHLEHSVLLAGIQSVDDDGHTRLVLSEAVDRLGHFGHELNFMLQNL